MTQVKIPTKKLNSGYEIPYLGYGTWLGLNTENLEFLYEDIPKLKTALEYAISIGYRHIDTAHLYRVEGAIGEVVEKMVKEGKVKREELFITTKLWNHMHAFEDVERSLRGSLKRLRLDYVDLFLVHWPMSVSEEGVDMKIDYTETWRGMEAVHAKGLARSVGVSNFNVEQLTRLLGGCKVVPAMNQIEVNLNLGVAELVNFCHDRNIAVTGYTPFGTMLSSSPTPEPKPDHPVLKELQAKYKKTSTQIVLRYLYQRGIIVIPKSITPSRILENSQIFDFTISADDEKLLAKFDNGFRTVRPVWWQDYTYYPFEKVKQDGAIEIPVILRKLED